MAVPVLSSECEYAMSCYEQEYALGDRMSYAGMVMDAIYDTHPTLPGPMAGDNIDLFLENGSRVYIDQGIKIEFSQPECTSPKELVGYNIGNEKILIDAVDLVKQELQTTDIRLFKCNVDYLQHETWGSHENYSVSSEIEDLSKTLIPHLVSRIIYTGEGGWKPGSKGLKFVLSPRAHFFVTDVDTTTTYSRPIFNTKNEPLCNGMKRLHLICGANLCSQTAMYLKYGTTALIATLARRPEFKANNLSIEGAVDVFHRISSDPGCNAEFRLVDGRYMTAIQLQFKYLKAVEDFLGTRYLPEWAEEVCRVWRKTLESISQGSGAISQTLDWSIKQSLYLQYAADKGFGPRSLELWTDLFDQSYRCANLYGWSYDQIKLENLFSDHGTAALYVREKISLLRDHGENLNRGLKFESLRNELWELDARFGQLGSGIFAALDKADVLNHRIEGIADPETAMICPPELTRAKLRGRLVKELSGSSRNTVCNWDRIIDWGNRRQMLLEYLFQVEEQWSNIPPELTENTPDFMDFLNSMFHRPLRRNRR